MVKPEHASDAGATADTAADATLPGTGNDEAAAAAGGGATLAAAGSNTMQQQDVTESMVRFIYLARLRHKCVFFHAYGDSLIL